VHAVRLGRAEARVRPTVDKGYRTADVRWDHGMELTGSDPDLLAARGALACAAQLVGLAVRLLELAVAHVTVRTQFGVPVGSQQAVKHHLADVRLGIEYARPVVWRAAYALAHDEPAAARDCSFAKVYAGNAAWTAAKSALQCHGAIGYSAEHDLHLFLKRVWALDAAWGTRARHRRAVADAVLA
jgi:alkylation response protein AidB-like acyl-CoA dehydrogenase